MGAKTASRSSVSEGMSMGSRSNSSSSSSEFSLCSRSASSGLSYPWASMDLTKFHDSAHAHDFQQPLSRIVMVRKMEQRTYVAASKQGQGPKIETLTKETVQTFRGNKTERKVTTSEKRDVSAEIGDAAKELISLSRSTCSSPELTVDRKGGRRPLSRCWSSGSGSGSGSSKSSSLSRLATDTSSTHSSGTNTINTTNTINNTTINSSEFAKLCLQAHNEYRAKHHVPPLKLNKKLCKYSEEWAKHLASKGILEHRQNSAYGQNIFCSWSSAPRHTVCGQEPVDSWYEEIKFHPFGKEPSSLKSGHFSQVVWLTSAELGVGVARSRNGQIFVVANYDPPGNFLGQFSENVPPLGGFPKFSEDYEKSLLKQYDAKTFTKEALDIHNEYRCKHHVPKLILSKKLCDYAKEWALILVKDEKLSHRDSRYGENIFSMWSSGRVTAKDACEKWYEEGKDYNYSVEPRNLKSGNFTQMIWKSSKEVGFAMIRGKSGRVVIVANYHPAGNISGQFIENVLKP